MKRLSILVIGMMSAPALGAEQPCELHVWPAHATNSVSAGVLSNLGPVGLYADMKANRDESLRDQVALIETLGAPQQAQAIVATDLPHLLGLGSVRLVFQSANLDPRSAPKQRARMSGSTAPCYAELIVTMNEYRNSAVFGASLRTELTFKDFRNGKARIVRDSPASPLHHFPARTSKEAQLARQDVSDAFTANLRGFAESVNRSGR
jgi:hypothetical protein